MGATKQLLEAVVKKSGQTALPLQIEDFSLSSSPVLFASFSLLLMLR